MIKAVIFDMDGLLIDSEPLWEIAELKIFQSVGVPLTPELTKKTMGMRSDEVVHYWHNRHPWANPPEAAVNEQLVQAVVELVKTQGQPQPGVHELITLFKAANLPMAIASSSPESIIDAVIGKLGIRNAFTVVQSAQHEPYGKPHPGVYITAAQKLGVRPEQCLAFEDSTSGVLSAKAAKMTCVAVPDAKLKGDHRFAIADLTLSSLADFTPAMLEKIA